MLIDNRNSGILPYSDIWKWRLSFGIHEHQFDKLLIQVTNDLKHEFTG